MLTSISMLKAQSFIALWTMIDCALTISFQEKINLPLTNQIPGLVCINNDDKAKSFMMDGREIRLAPFEMRVIEEND